MGDERHNGDQGSSVACPVHSQADARERLTAKDVMQYGVVSIDRQEPVYKAVSLLLERKISGLVVTEKSGSGAESAARLAGMLSEKDLLRLVCERSYLPGRVEDYMTARVATFDVEDDVELICRQLSESPYRHAPIVLNEQPAGMITRADLIRAYKHRFRPSSGGGQCPSCLNLLAQDVMHHGLLTVYPETSLYTAMDVIATHSVTGLPVVNREMTLLGIITEKDLLNCILDSARPGSPVGAYMVTDLVAFERRTPLEEVCRCLLENDFHRVPILEGRRLVGIVSRSDILRKRASFFKTPAGQPSHTT